MFQADSFDIDTMNFKISCVREVINRSDNWLNLAFLESLAINERKPKLNHGFKLVMQGIASVMIDDIIPNEDVTSDE